MLFLVYCVDAVNCKMLPKRQKLIQAKSASADVNSNHSIISMFAKQRSHSRLQDVEADSQCVISQVANLSVITDRTRFDNRLSLSLHRKRLHSDTEISISDSIDISERSCTVTQASEKMPEAVNDRQNESLSEASLSFTENYRDNVSLISSNQHSSFTTNQEDALICDGNSTSNLIPAEQNSDETEAARVPYYLENFLLVLDSVFKDTFYAELFNDDDFSTLNTFKSLSGNCASDDAIDIRFFAVSAFNNKYYYLLY